MTDEEMPAKKGGRPRLYPGTEKRPTLTFRVRGDTHGQLRAAAQVSGRSLSEEIEHRVAKSFHDADLMKFINSLIWKNAIEAKEDVEQGAVGGRLNYLIGQKFAAVLHDLQINEDNLGGDRIWTRDRIKALVEEKGASELIPALLAHFPFPCEPDADPDEIRREEAVERSRVLHERKAMQREQD